MLINKKSACFIRHSDENSFLKALIDEFLKVCKITINNDGATVVTTE